MSGALIRWELRKLFGVPMFGVFLILCLCFNLFFVFSERCENEAADYVSFVAEVEGAAGSQMGPEFDAALAALPSSEYGQRLISETRGAEDILEEYDTGQLRRFYSQYYPMSGLADELQERKFQRLQTSVEELAARDASLSVAAAGVTKPLLNSLFGTLCRLIITEGMLLAMLMALYSCGSERQSRTESSVYTTRTGRRVQAGKLIASAITALGAYGLLAGLSLLAFSFAWKLGPIWGASMSSQFYYVSSLGVAFPFISWTHFTIAGYLAATLLLGGAVVLIFHLLGFAFGLLTGNVYTGFLACMLFAAFSFGAMMACGDGGFWLAYLILQWTPVSLWWGQTLWFTGLDLGSIVSFQECRTALLCLAVLAGAVLILYCRFCRKDVIEHAA